MAARPLAATEVPIVGSDDIQWLDVAVPSSAAPPSPDPCGPASDDAADCHILENPHSYLIWRIHRSSPRTIELMELAPSEELSKFGLRVTFPDSLCPFGFVYRDEIEGNSEKRFVVYAITVSGVGYVVRLGNFSSYVSGSVLSQSAVEAFDVQRQHQSGRFRAVAATLGCLAIGREDGSVSCFQLGDINQGDQGVLYDLRDDVGVGRLWGLMSRVRPIGSVQDMSIREVDARKLLIVIHEDGSLRVWDLFGRAKLHTQSISIPGSPGLIPSRLWLGDPKYDNGQIPMAISYKAAVDAEREVVAVYSLLFIVGEKLTISSQVFKQNITFDEGKLIDIKITSDKLWILKEDGSMLYDLSLTEINRSSASGYGLLEAFVADQLFQGSELASDDFIWATLSLISSMKGQMFPIISSIFLRRILHPGVRLNAALCRILQDNSRNLTQSDLQSLSVNDIKNEIITVIENRGITDNPISVYYQWKRICSQYFQYWCQSCAPYRLFFDSSTGAIGLIRKSSVSLFRCLEDIELLIYGCVDESGSFASSGLVLPYDEDESKILLEILRCISSINHQLGRSASILYYEALANPQMISPEDIFPQLLKFLDVGYNISVVELLKSQVGADVVREKEKLYHKNQRKFSVEMLFSFRHLCSKASSWNGVLDVLEKFLEYLIPHKHGEGYVAKEFFNTNSLLLVQATSQVARVMLESAFDVLLLLGYLVNIGGQILMDHKDISRVQGMLIPKVQQILSQWLIVNLMGTLPSESPILEDFSAQLSLLCIDKKNDKRSWDKKLGRYDFTLASVLLLKFPGSREVQTYLTSSSFPKPDNFVTLVQNFSGWIVWGDNNKGSLPFIDQVVDLAKILLEHHQYEAVENLLVLTEAHVRKEKVYQSIHGSNGSWCMLLHLLGYSLVVQSQSTLSRALKEQKNFKAVSCFFRAACGEGAGQALKSFPFQTDLLYSSTASSAVWRFQYYQSVMHLFEQYNMSEGACQFALAALEQVDEVVGSMDNDDNVESLLEPPIAIRGRLWGNVFKFKLDLNSYTDAYCAILSNPDEEWKNICLRRFLIVLCERGATKVLCDGELPFVGLVDKVVQELIWKAERSDITAKPNPYKLLYAFEMHRHNWRKAASYMYQYSVRLSKEASVKEHHLLLSAFQERVYALTASINALSLVHPAYAWIDGSQISSDQHLPNKKPRKTLDSDVSQLWRVEGCVDIQKLENIYLITSAQYLLMQPNVKLTSTGSETNLSDMLYQLVEAELYDMAYTVTLKFWKGSGLKRELERVFVALSQKCCHGRVGFSAMETNGMLLTHGDRPSICGATEASQCEAVSRSMVTSRWEMLELHLRKYMKLHPRLPVTVAETLLHTDPQIELPLWLVQIFKGGRKAKCWGMTGQESDAATLFRLYVDYGRYSEATNLLLEYLESFSSLRPADVIKRKKMSAVWFPYTAIERLLCQLEELKKAGHLLNQCEKLKKLLHGALVNHLQQIKVDSEDVMGSAQSS